ncbi:NAD(P)/FAD-dependent oxidoreductase [Brevibacillus sp. TJ4]|uniref:NAD(P)/FAD-dependent oxidoreductase n=1 Tax=Brevibacillus sp. TJ4 TaxID=3234853 RepID=UPI0037CCC43E
MEHVQVLIAGGGIGGLSAAIWCHRLGLSSLLIEKTDALGGQLAHIHNEIRDFPPHVYPNGAALLSALTTHPTVAGLQPRLSEAIVSVDVHTHEITTSRSVYRADYLVVATGVSPNELPQLAGCRRVLSPWFSTTAQAKTVSGQDVAVIGGGDRALESAANLCLHARRVYLLVRSDRLRAQPQWIRRIASLPNLHIFWETQIDSYEAGAAGSIDLRLHSTRSDTPASIQVDWILPRIGVRGNSQGFAPLPTFGNYYLQTDSFQLAASDWIYAIGDVSNGAEYASLSLAAGQAMRAVKHISLSLDRQAAQNETR